MDCERKWNHGFATNMVMKRVINTYFCGLEFIVDPKLTLLYKCYNCVSWRLVLMNNNIHNVCNWHQLCGQVGVAAFDLRLASLHLSQYIETSSSYQNTKTLLHFYDPLVIIVTPNKLAPDGMVGVSELVDRFYATVKKVIVPNVYNDSCVCVCVCVVVYARSLGQRAPYLAVFLWFSFVHKLIPCTAFLGCNGPWLLWWYQGYPRYLLFTDF